MPIILAPSGSGKSHVTKILRQVGIEPSRSVVDGDDIINATVGWHPGRWWDDPDLEEDQRSKNERALRGYLAKHPGHIVLFNGDANRWHDLVVLVMVPSVRMHRENIQSRHEEAKNVVQPTEWQEITNNRIFARDIARHYNIPIVSTWGQAFAQLLPDYIDEIRTLRLDYYR